MQDLSDEQLAQHTQQGDAACFGVLIQRYEAKMTRYAKKFISQVEDIQDVVQEVFIKAYTNINNFDTNRRFSPWLYRIAHNEFVNTIKKKGNERVAFIDFDTFFPHPMAPDTADKGALTQELRTMLDTCLTRLTVKYREVLILYYMEELSYAEIADVLHVPIATVGVRLQRAKYALQKIYEQHTGNN